MMTVQSACASVQPAAADQLVRGAEQLHRVRVLPLRIAVGKELADVARAGGAEDRVGQRVRDRVGIRMAGQARASGEW